MDDKIRPFLHQHHLLIDKYEEQEAAGACCAICNSQIYDWALTCESCSKFWLDASCAFDQLPYQIQHPLHSRHPLIKGSVGNHCVCDKCFSLMRDYIYKCNRCDFKLDLICASSTTSNDETSRTTQISKKIQHFISDHYELTSFYYRKVGKDHYACDWCQKLLSVSGGISFGNISKYGSYKEVFFHESCLINMPTIIPKHHFHPSHPLYIRREKEDDNHPHYYCNACKGEVRGLGAYSCQNCKFYLHVDCATLQPSLKLDVHDHHLTYFRKRSYYGALPCKRCGKRIEDEGRSHIAMFYACVQCDFILHFSCASIPFSIKHEYHRHQLKPNHSFIEDVSGDDECYCDICEKERKPKDSVYCCVKCTFVAHIGCALNKFMDHGSTYGLVDSKDLIMKPLEQEDIQNTNANLSTSLKTIHHFDHPHPLTFYEVIGQNVSVVCKACCLEISDQVYGCESCEYYLHKTCTQLPYELLHRLHREHSLKLYNAGWVKLACHVCKDCSDGGFAYVCFVCGFMLDIKCISNSSVPKNAIQRPREKEEEIRPPKLCPLNQNHKLYFINYGSNFRNLPRCYFCNRRIMGPSYGCFNCGYEVHEYCLGFPLEMQLQFHERHPFYPIPYHEGQEAITCKVCMYQITDQFGYSCWECDLHLHPACAIALVRVVKFKSHDHNLYYFRQPDEFYNYYNNIIGQLCNGCKKWMYCTPFYFCMECGFKLHFECAKIPHSVKSKYHIHPLTLKDHLVEDHSREYYCDICEEERYSEDHVYCCEECQGLFVAHIDCTLNSMEQTTPAILEAPSNDDLPAIHFSGLNVDEEAIKAKDSNFYMVQVKIRKRRMF